MSSTVTYSAISRGPRLDDLSRKSYKYDKDIFNPEADIPDDAIILDEMDIILIDAWSKYIHAVEALLWQFCCNTVDDSDLVKNIFYDTIVDSSKDRFNHFFHISEQAVSYIKTLSNLDKGKDLYHLLKNNYVFFFAKSLRDKYSVETYVQPNELDYTSYISSPLVSNTNVSTKRALSSSFCTKPTAMLASIVEESKNTIRAFTSLRALMNKAKKKLGSSDMLSSMASDMRTLESKIRSYVVGEDHKNSVIKNSSTILDTKNHKLTGYYPIDCVMGGMENNDINLLVSEQGYGKSQELIQIGLEMVAKKQDKVLFFSPELPFAQVEQRIWSFCFKGFDFMAHNKGAYSKEALQAMKSLCELSPTFKAITENFVVVDYEGLGYASTESNKPFEFGEKVLNKAIEMQKTHNFDCLLMDSLYQYVPDHLFQARYVRMIKNRFCNYFNKPVWTSTQLKPNDGKHYLHDDVTMIDKTKLGGGTRMADDISSCYGVFNGYNTEEKTYFKKLFYIKKRISLANMPSEIINTDRRESTYTISPLEVYPVIDIHKKSVADIIYEELTAAGLGELYNKVRVALNRDKDKHEQENRKHTVKEVLVTEDAVRQIELALLGQVEDSAPVEESDPLDAVWKEESMHPWKKRIYSTIQSKIEDCKFEELIPLSDEELYFFESTGRSHFFDGTVWTSSPPAGVLKHLIETDDLMSKDKAKAIYINIKRERELARYAEEQKQKRIETFGYDQLDMPIADLIELQKRERESAQNECQVQQPTSKKEDESLPARLEPVLPEG